MNDSKTTTEALDWYGERYQSVFVSRNRWLVIALVGLLLAAIQAIALVLLVPLKTSVPFLIKEELSGAVTTISPIDRNKSASYDESIRKYFLAKYAIARETYDSASLAESYRTVALMSDPATNRVFTESIQNSNPRSPIVVYGKRGTRTIRIKSISFLNDHLAQIRLTAAEQRNQGQQLTNEWVAIVGFEFGVPPILEAERLINPLGFLVTSYRIDQEVVQ